MSSVVKHLNENEYASSYKGYIEKVEYADPVQLLIDDLEKQLIVLENISDEHYSYRYAEGKWSIAEMIIHLSDSECVFARKRISQHTNILG